MVYWGALSRLWRIRTNCVRPMVPRPSGWRLAFRSPDASAWLRRCFALLLFESFNTQLGGRGFKGKGPCTSQLRKACKPASHCSRPFEQLSPASSTFSERMTILVISPSKGKGSNNSSFSAEDRTSTRRPGTATDRFLGTCTLALAASPAKFVSSFEAKKSSRKLARAAPHRAGNDWRVRAKAAVGRCGFGRKQRTKNC